MCAERRRRRRERVYCVGTMDCCCMCGGHIVNSPTGIPFLFPAISLSSLSIYSSRINYCMVLLNAPRVSFLFALLFHSLFSFCLSVPPPINCFPGTNISCCFFSSRVRVRFCLRSFLSLFSQFSFSFTAFSSFSLSLLFPPLQTFSLLFDRSVFSRRTKREREIVVSVLLSRGIRFQDSAHTVFLGGRDAHQMEEGEEGR